MKTCLCSFGSVFFNNGAGFACVRSRWGFNNSWQVFAEQELDNDGDGGVTVQDVFAFLQNAWAIRGQQRGVTRGFSRTGNKAWRLGRPRTLDDVHRGLDRRRMAWRQGIRASGTESIPTSVEHKLLAAARWVKPFLVFAVLVRVFAQGCAVYVNSHVSSHRGAVGLGWL